MRSTYLLSHTGCTTCAGFHVLVIPAAHRSRAVAGHGEAALARQRHGSVGVDVVDPHPYAGDAPVAADATQVGLAQRGAALRRRAVGRVIHRRRGLAQLEVLVRHAADGVGALHCGEGHHHGEEQCS
jgi:hypothetical protein